MVTSLQPCLVRYHLTTDTGQVIGAELLGLPIHARNGSRFHIFGGIFPLRDLSNLGYSAITFMELTATRSIWTEPLPGDKLVASLNNPDIRPQGPPADQGWQALGTLCIFLNFAFTGGD